ncbi:unnamed protein product [Rotaria sordida]|uniref:Uncharacterized protein n=1 Tax=Rotaria sordida TaxID=392033 RepID=A0A818Q8M1_9BILA|nr:unnamed protein product [Rotaria sordida]
MDLVSRSSTKYHLANINDDTVSNRTSNNGFRFMDKNGRINIIYSSFGRVKHMHSNAILFIMQSDWWLVLTFVLFGFILSWFFFAFLYFLISIEHGDFVLNEDEQALLDNQTNYTQQYLKIEREKCVKDVHNFLSALLFSIETQHTIGYGSRYITTECMGGILVLTLQSSLGYLLQVIVTQIVFTKLSRPTEKSQFIIFSNYALIASRDNQLTLTIRIVNLSTSQMIFATVRLLMIRQRRTLEGEIIPHQIYDMELTHLCNGQLFFLRPTIVEHIINSRSPLYGIQQSTLEKEHFEIIAIIEGSFDHTGFSCHFRTSYLPNELLWGYQFSPCNPTLSGFDYDKFNRIQLIDAPHRWSYEDEELNDTKTSDIPISLPYLYYTNFNERLQRENLFDDTRPSTKGYNRLSAVESISNNNFRHITTIKPIDIDEELDEVETFSYKSSEQNNRLIIYHDYHFHQAYPIEYQKQEINRHIEILQQWLENNIDKDSIDDETDNYFDCIDKEEFDNDVDNQYLAINCQDHLYDNNLVQIFTNDYSWISEIWLSIHRKTGKLRRFLNYFNQSRKRSLTNIVEEFVRIYGGSFNHAIGSRFHISYANEKWVLILKNIKLVKYPAYPYPQTRIIFIRKGVSFIAR